VLDGLLKACTRCVEGTQDQENNPNHTWRGRNDSEKW